MAWLHLGTWITLGLLWWKHGEIRLGGLTVLDWTCLIIIGGCAQTVWIRLHCILADLRAKASSTRHP
jgi:hypothetical protein